MTHPTHPTPDELAQWVCGVTVGAQAKHLEAHVVTCPDCSAALAREARVELALSKATRSAPPGRWWVVPAVAVPLAAAAALVMLLVDHPADRADAGQASAFIEVPRFEGTTPYVVLNAPASLEESP